MYIAIAYIDIMCVINFYYVVPDIDECALDTDGCEQGCINTPGSFQCDCSEGYLLNANGFTCDGGNIILL